MEKGPGTRLKFEGGDQGADGPPRLAHEWAQKDPELGQDLLHPPDAEGRVDLDDLLDGPGQGLVHRAMQLLHLGPVLGHGAQHAKHPA